MLNEIKKSLSRKVNRPHFVRSSPSVIILNNLDTETIWLKDWYLFKTQGNQYG